MQVWKQVGSSSLMGDYAGNYYNLYFLCYGFGNRAEADYLYQLKDVYLVACLAVYSDVVSALYLAVYSDVVPALYLAVYSVSALVVYLAQYLVVYLAVADVPTFYFVVSSFHFCLSNKHSLFYRMQY